MQIKGGDLKKTHHNCPKSHDEKGIPMHSASIHANIFKKVLKVSELNFYVQSGLTLP